MILEAKSKEEWDSAGRLSTPAWCFYKNDENNGKIYGKLYNWFAVNDPRGIAPNGFKIPSKEDFQLLIHQLNGQYYSKEKLKSKKYWQKDLEGTDSSGFNAIPSGRRAPYFEGLNENTSFWTATESKQKNYALAFQYSAFGFLISESPKFSGYSMRVLKI